MDFPLFEKVTRPILAGPLNPSDLSSIYIIRECIYCP
jgi:hypothetical protein